MWYFAYGSNMDPAQMTERRVAYAAGQRARLADHRLDFDLYSQRYGAGVADIVRSPGGSVEGVLYEVDEAGLATLDSYEGVEVSTYRRLDVAVATDDGEVHNAVAYEVIAKVPFIAPHPDYLAKLVRGAEAFGLSAAYIRKLRSLPVAS